jgi:chemotaxis response regulator CheB
VAATADVMRRAVELKPEHRVVWVAARGAEAVELCARQTPDLILLDLPSAGKDGVDTARRIMAETPCAILLVTASVRASAGMVFEAMGHGALDAVDTPPLHTGQDRRRVRAAHGQDRHDLAARRRQTWPAAQCGAGRSAVAQAPA